MACAPTQSVVCPVRLIPILRHHLVRLLCVSGLRQAFLVDGSNQGSFRGSLKRSARAVQLFGRLAVLETHTL